jgi:hypothetical protein
LFRSDCKSKDGWIDEFVTLTKTNGRLDYRFTADVDYGLLVVWYIFIIIRRSWICKRSYGVEIFLCQGICWIRKGEYL